MALLAEAARGRAETETYDNLVVAAGEKPQDPAGHRKLAQWCQGHGHLSRAIFEWQEVLTLLPQDAEAKAGAARLLAKRG